MRIRILLATVMAFLALALLALALVSCKTGEEPENVAVTLEPTAVTLAPGASTAFEATVTGGSDPGVEWTVTGGTVDVHASGVEIAYTAPATEGTYDVTATSTADPNASATATVTVRAVSIVTVSISPSAATLAPGGTLGFMATVTGSTDTAVTWLASCGSIAGTGTTVTYTAPASEGSCTVTATSSADPSEQAEAIVRVVAAPLATVTVTPSAATLAPGESQPFTATVSGLADTSVTWAASCGSIAGTGSAVTYTAPASEGTCTVTATSVADPTESASAVVTVVEPASVSVSLSPSAATLAPGGAQAFTATVTGSTGTAVSWRASCGSIAGTGSTVTYTAPASEGTCTVRATSVADPTESASATVTVTAPDAVVVTVTPTSATLRIGGTETFTSSVTGTSDTGVTWSATGGTFSGETAVVYTAPDVLGTYTLTAISDADPSKSASAAIRVVAHPDELWAIQYGTSEGDAAGGVAVDGDGNVYVVGTSEGDLFGPAAGSQDGYLLKLDSDGSEVWTRTLGTAGAITGLYGVAVGPGGNTVVAGRTTGSLAGAGSHVGNEDVLVAKYAPNGHRLWIHQAGSSQWDQARAVAIDLVGNVFVVGATYGDLGGPGTHKGGWDAFLMKLDPNGNHVWTRQAGTSADDEGYGVATGAAGNVVMTGFSNASLFGPHQGGRDAFVLKMSAAGDFMWASQFGTSALDWATGAAIDLAGNVIAIGTTGGSLPGPGLYQGAYDAWVAKLGPDGTPLWARQYGTPDYDRLHAVAVGWAGNIVAVGDTLGALAESNPAGVWDALVVKVDADGVLTWTRQFGTGVTGEHTMALDVAIGPAGNVLAVGRTEGSLAGPYQGWLDAFVIKLAP